MGINNTKPSKEYESYLSSLDLVRQEYSPEFSSELSIYKKDNALDPDELILVREQMFDDESDPICIKKQKEIELRKVYFIDFETVYIY